MSLSDIAILYIKCSEYCCIINLINENDAMNFMQNADLTQKKRNVVKHKNVLSHIKMANEILTFGYIKIEKIKFYRNKTLILLDINI